MNRILVVDDNPPTREQIVQALSDGGMFEVIAEAETSDEAWKLAKQLLPDIVILDLHLPGLIQTPDLITRLTGLKNVKVVIFASQGKACEVQDLFDMGASAYVIKSDPIALIKMSLLMVSRGSRGIVSPALPGNLLRLSAQERNILKELTKRGGLTKAPQRMGISLEDFYAILDHLCTKLEVEDPEKLVKWAKKHGY